jgi:hypothetical protein
MLTGFAGDLDHHLDARDFALLRKPATGAQLAARLLPLLEKA